MSSGNVSVSPNMKVAHLQHDSVRLQWLLCHNDNLYSPYNGSNSVLNRWANIHRAWSENRWRLL